MSLLRAHATVANLKGVDDTPLDLRDTLAPVEVETMVEVLACALLRVVLLQGMNGPLALEQLAGAEDGARSSRSRMTTATRSSRLSCHPQGLPVHIV